MKDGDLVLPGDYLATPEEYMAGEGAYSDGRRVVATVTGRVRFDRGTITARVMGKEGPALPAVGDVVHAIITKINPKRAQARILRIEGRERELASNMKGNLQAFNVSKGGGVKVNREFRDMEFIRAEVIQSSPSIQLSTKSPGMGTIRGYCRICRGVLGLKGSELHCPACHRSEKRKVADNYGLDLNSHMLNDG